MSLLTVLFVAAAQAAPPTISVGVGRQSFVTDDMALAGTAARAALLWHTGNLEIGPVLQSSTHNYQRYETQAATGQIGASPGDFQLTGLGPEFSLPALVDGRSIRFGAHFDILAELFRAPMDANYYTSEVLQDTYAGVAPSLGIRSIIFSGGAGADLAVALAPRRPAPELVVSLDAAYHMNLGVSVMPSIGMRVGAGE